jgi:hypothetical protein
MFNTKSPNINIYYKPFPVMSLKKFIDEEYYVKLVDAFPEKELFEFKQNLGKKYSLSETNNKKNFFAYINKKKLWSDFFKIVKSKKFLQEIIDMLYESNINLGLKNSKQINLESKNFLKNLKNILKKNFFLKSKFEFSMMSGNGGYILPHTDAPEKIITIVIPILNENEWKKEWGGGTSMLEPIDEKNYFNQQNKYLNFDEVRPLKNLPFESNNSTLFIKTFNSLHCVYPIQGPDTILRKSLTINIQTLF